MPDPFSKMQAALDRLLGSVRCEGEPGRVTVDAAALLALVNWRRPWHGGVRVEPVRHLPHDSTTTFADHCPGCKAESEAS